MATNDSRKPEDENSTAKARYRPFSAAYIMAFSGYILLLGAISLAGVLAYGYLRIGIPDPTSDQMLLPWTIQHFGLPVLLVIGIAMLGTIGIKLLGAAGETTPTAIPPDDRALLEPLIQTGNKEAIGQYVILASLSGFAGNFQKIGFTGLPLATVALTLVFSALSFYSADFLDLAKLTLGAFIGSFVQRSQGRQDGPTLSA